MLIFVCQLGFMNRIQGWLVRLETHEAFVATIWDSLTQKVKILQVGHPGLRAITMFCPFPLISGATSPPVVQIPYEPGLICIGTSPSRMLSGSGFIVSRYSSGQAVVRTRQPASPNLGKTWLLSCRYFSFFQEF